MFKKSENVYCMRKNKKEKQQYYKLLDGYSLRLNDSLRLRMTLIMTITVIAIIVVFWGINWLFLESFYEETKLNAIEEAYEFVNSEYSKEYIDSYNNGEISDKEVDKVLTQVERTSSVGSLSVFIYRKYKVGKEDYYELYYPANNSHRELEHFRQKIKGFVKNQKALNANI